MEDEFIITLYTYTYIKRVVRELKLSDKQESKMVDIAIESINTLLKNNLMKNDKF